MEKAFKNYSVRIKIIDSPLSLLSSEYNREKRYYDGPAILERIYTLGKRKDYFRTLGIINKDIFSKDRNDIVFGIARLPRNEKYKKNGVALISLTQLRKKERNKHNWGEEFKKRIFKEALHELGHTFGLHHCKNECVMQFSNNLKKSDEKPFTFCKQCKNKLNTFFIQNI